MVKHFIAILFVFPAAVFAQDMRCPKGYQPYANRCVTQRMADYISCVEASGGNRQEISEEVSEIGGQKASAGVKGSGSGVIVKGSGSLVLDKASEKALAKKLETRWFPKGMSECTRVLDKATVQEIKKAVQDATIQTTGVLMPGNKPTPSDLPCKDPIPAGDLILLLGNSVAYTNTFPHTVIRVGRQPLLVVNKHQTGLTITARFFSDDLKIVAELKENRFFVNPNNYFRLEKPNNHALVVYDQRGDQALNVEFLNASAIKLLGRFYMPNRPPIIIGEDTQTLSGAIFSGFCVGRNGVDFQL